MAETHPSEALEQTLPACAAEPDRRAASVRDVPRSTSTSPGGKARSYARLMAAPDPSPMRRNELSRAEMRRLRQEGIERRKRWLADRDAFLEAQLDPGEVVVARSGDHP